MLNLDENVPNEILEYVKSKPAFELELHGYSHWNRVFKNAIALADLTNARTEHSQKMFALFAILHDHTRAGDGACKIHGYTAAQEIDVLLASDEDLSIADVKLLKTTIELHTVLIPNSREANTLFNNMSHCEKVFLQICLDADRLDIDRVFPNIDVAYLFNDEAKKEAMYKNIHRKLPKM